MCALGHKRTFAVQRLMSALPPKADMCSATRDVRYGPEADSCTAASSLHVQRSRARIERPMIQSLSLSVRNGSSSVKCVTRWR
jgi:hypothetical protein